MMNYTKTSTCGPVTVEEIFERFFTAQNPESPKTEIAMGPVGVAVGQMVKDRVGLCFSEKVASMVMSAEEAEALGLALIRHAGFVKLMR